MLFLNVANETAQLQVQYRGDHFNSWEPPEEWGISRPPKPAAEAPA